ncbi:MAG TPA: PsbP-related protein [Methanothrix sp.]|nr:PsbP-related protein [Methanothrix sp.]
MFKKIFLLVVLIASTAAVSAQSCPAVSQDSSEIDESVDTSGAVGLSDLGEMLLYENSQYGFSVSYPSDWSAEEPDPNELGIVTGFLAPGESIDDPMNYVTVQIEDLPAGTTLSGYTQAVLTNLRSSYPDFQLLAEGEMIISEEPAHVIAYAVSVDGTAYQVLLAYTIKDDRAYIVTYYALADSYAEFEDAAKMMINSFSLV